MLQGRTLWELVEARAEVSGPECTATDESGRSMSFAELRDRSERVAAALASRGIGPGDVVTWQLPTWLESMVLAAALARLGAVQNPILHIYREREVEFCVRQAGARMLVVPTTFASFGFAEMARKMAADVGALDVLTCDRELPEADPVDLPPPPVSDEEVRWLFYTSGTTADPKGARHTDGTLRAITEGMMERFEVTAEDRNGLVFPFPHVGGVVWLFGSMMTGCRNILFDAFVPDRVIEVLGREGVTLAGAGTVFHKAYLVAQQRSEAPIFPAVRGFPGGGAPKPPQLHYDMKEAFGAGILSAYGLTEAPILTLSSPRDSDEDLAYTEGTPMRGVELRIVTEDGAVAAPGEEGEVRVKAPQVMKGYVDSSLDAEVFDEDGWFRTGDLGRLDERSMLRITGRLKDVIIRKGENISAREVEDHLYRHPKVVDAAVIGVPDPERGEMVCAVVQTAADQDPITLEEMAGFLKGEGLMMQKLPERLELLDVLPRNPAGKVLKQELRARYGA